MKRIFERLREEYGYAGGITIVKDYVRAQRLRHREVFGPLRHDPGHAQVDFGDADLGGAAALLFARMTGNKHAAFITAFAKLAKAAVGRRE